MSNETTVVEKKEQKELREKYNNFVKQIGISNILFNSAKFEKLDKDFLPQGDNTILTWTSNATYENKPDIVNVSQSFEVIITTKESKETKANVSLNIVVIYSSKIPMDDTIFEAFKKINVGLNTWPYFREYIHSALTRMGWPPFIAPVYRVNS